MDILSKIFGKKSIKTYQEQKAAENIVLSPECKKLYEIKSKIEELLGQSHYVARSEYLDLIPEYEKTVEYFKVLENSGTLDVFCERNYMSMEDVRHVLAKFSNLNLFIDAANEEYIRSEMTAEKAYLDEILKEVDPKISLDFDQRKVVLTDEDYSLVIAGAGAGKTTTVAAKVKYLVEKKNIDPKDILVISFTNKAVGELRDKINKDLKLECPITTFHSAGNAVLHLHNPEQVNIVDSSRLYFLLQDYFREAILKNETLVNNLILFFASYFDAPYEGADLNEFFNKTAKANFTTMRSDLDEFKREIIDTRTKKKVTIQNEILRSHQEVEIANFLYLNNIEYEYEPIYPYNIAFARKPYTPDFIIKQGERTAYIEHFGITEDGKNHRYSEEELTRYKKSINDKVLLHREHRTCLIYTFSAYKDHREITSHLKEKLEAEGFVLNPRSNKEIMNKLIASEESRYIRRLVGLICRFITNFKTNGYTAEEFGRMYHLTQNVRSRLFLNICEDCYLEYKRYLKENNAVDFEDMINESADILRKVKEMKQKLHFRYIIVDEYQDISRQRFDLTTALSEVTDAKIIAVGDDWQSIYAFSGSDISLFTKFEEKMGYAKLLKIVRTYRNAQEVIDIAGNFVQKNPSQIVKTLHSPKHISDPVIIYTYDGTYKKSTGSRKTGALYATASAVETALERIISYNRAEGKKEGEDGSILLLGRYGFDGDQLEKSGLFEYKTRGSKLKSVKYPKLNITFMTVHMAKGLGYDNVIVVNGKNETYGFPSKIEDDPVLSFVIKGDHSIDYAEERRLFYVAMTRTKNRVYFIAPEQNPSEFLLEIKRDYKNVILKGNWNEEEIKKNFARKSCPICGYPMQLRYKNAYGLRLYICTNIPELCGFMTNDMKAEKLSVIKCDKCRDGFLIAKKGGNGSYFLGCTNYKVNKTGCGHTMSADHYYTQMGLEREPVPAVKFQKGLDISSEPRRGDKVEMRIIETDKKSNMYTPSERKTKKAEEKYQTTDMKLLLKQILSALKHISEERFFGADTLVRILKGADEPEVKKYGLQNIPEYGCCSFMSEGEIKATIRWLLDHHFMIQTRESHAKLHITYEGNHHEETITPGMVKKFVKYLNDPDREIFEEI